MPSLLAGVAMSTTSVAVVYAVMLETGFNSTDYGKVVLAACFVTDLGTVLALGLIFAPFTYQDAGVCRRLHCGADLLAVDHGTVLSAVWQPSLRARNQILAVIAVRIRRVGNLGRQRSGVARISDRHDPGWKRREGSHLHQATTHAVLRLPHAILLHPSGLFRVCSGASRCASRVLVYACCKADHEDSRGFIRSRSGLVLRARKRCTPPC